MSLPAARPHLANQYLDDRPLRALLRRQLSAELLAEIEPSLVRMGALAAGPLLELATRYRHDEPEHIPYDTWGERIDQVRVSPAWEEYRRVACREGLVALPYERPERGAGRTWQAALVYLFDRSSEVYTCPLAMTDGCARTLASVAPPAIRDRALPRLLSRDPEAAWTSGQWMTERTGGSDVGLSETVARSSPDGWRLSGLKWFTSAIDCSVALTLARPEGNGPGGRNLALFYVELRDADGRLNGLRIRHLKKKLGTRQLPTAELELDGTRAIPLVGLTDGVRHMATMLNVTRTWNAVCSVASMRRGLALARDFARQRVAFGAPLADKPLYLETLATLAAEHEAALQLAFYLARLLGQSESEGLSAREAALLRLVTPVTKLLTARQAVAAASEIVECFGGAGYVEDTGVPQLLRDAQVLSIWEGTTSVLSLEAYRAIARTPALEALVDEVQRLASATRHPALTAPAAAAQSAARRARAFIDQHAGAAAGELEPHARRFAMTVGRALSLALLVEQAQWALDTDHDGRSVEAARRFAAAGVDLLPGAEAYEARSARGLALEEPGAGSRELMTGGGEA